jgi:GNAT superfamily N-acetyltransferase
MPAMLDDPSAPTIYRTSGSAPFPGRHAHLSLPIEVYPRQVTLRDRSTVATIVPFSSRHQVPPSLLAYLSDQLNKEIDMGDTYPMIDTMTVDNFSSYWFQNFGAVMLLGNIESADDVVEGKNWATACLGSFYIKPNYPGRSSHVCNAGFLVTEAARNKGVGRLMGESYLEWAPRLGYTYSVFNLVYETNVASCKIWDALGFKRIGRVKGAGNLKSYPEQLVDAIIYGRDLGPEGSDFVSEERFDKIAFYLRYGKYPAGADRAEKSRLRSAATHYKLLDNDKLMLKDKEVIADPTKQYEIAQNVHVLQHGGINKTTATIAEKYHWVRIKETVSLVIKNCAECKELGKSPFVRADGVTATSRRPLGQGGVSAAGRILSLPHPNPSDATSFAGHHQQLQGHNHQHHPHPHQTSVSPQVFNRSLPSSNQDHTSSHLQQSSLRHPHLHRHPRHLANSHEHSSSTSQLTSHHSQQNIREDYMPVDPQIMEDVRIDLGSYNHHQHQHPHSPTFPGHDGLAGLDHHDPGAEGDDSFQAMLGEGPGTGHGGTSHGGDGDLDMLIDQEDSREGLDRETSISSDIDEKVGGLSHVEVVARAAEEALRSGRRGFGKG